jgi:hypothetical protein
MGLNPKVMVLAEQAAPRGFDAANVVQQEVLKHWI